MSLIPFDLGDTVPLGVDVTDAAGAPTTPASIVLTLGLPDGTTATPTVANPSTGRYQVNYVPTMAGRYEVRWVSTGPATAFADVFDVRPAAPAYLVSLADVRRHLNLTTATHDEELRGHIEAATAAIEEYLREVVARRTVVEMIEPGRPSRRVSLGFTPVLSLTSVASLDGATTWDVADLAVSDAGTLTVQSGSALSGAVVVTYVAGRSIIPASYARAAELVVETLYRSQRAPAVGPPVTPVGAEEMEPDAYGVVMSPKVRELLGVSGPLVA